MRTTIDIDPKLLGEAEEILGESSPSKTVNAALSELVRKYKLKKLGEMLETMELDYDWEKEEERELKAMRHDEE
jgi:Arc/MetJ family transcription regulator